jgi:cellulase
LIGDCTTLTPGSLRWSKISQAGLITPGGTGTWVTDNLIKTNFTSTTTIPKNLKAGNYVIRHEIIALHGGQSDNGAQLYPQVRLATHTSTQEQQLADNLIVSQPQGDG